MDNVKAVILAGGMGTRLRPITYTTPKPLCRIMGKSVIEILLNSIELAGIKEAVISTMYMSEAFLFLENKTPGKMKITVVRESMPLGSAGGVKYALTESDSGKQDTFIIMSGDGVFDFDIKEILKYHYTKEADVTIVTYPCAEPLEFGVILTDENNKVTSFCEKPSWSDVKSDMINTGIYVFNKRVLDIIPNNRFFDISKDLFPFLLGQGMKIYSYEAQGYWCDIGSINEFYSCNIDALCGNIRTINNKSRQIQTKDNTLQYYISDKAKISSSANVGDNCIIENNVSLDDNTKVESSIIMHDVKISSGTGVEKSIICEGVTIGKNCKIKAGSIIGAYTIIGDDVIFDSGIRIWPRKTIGRGYYLTTDIFNDSNKTDIYGDDGYIAGKITEPVNTNFITKLGVAIANSLRSDSAGFRSVKAGVLHNGESGCALIAETLLCAMKSAGIQCYSFLKGFESQALFLASETDNDLIIFIGVYDDIRSIKLYNTAGIKSKDLERKIELKLKATESSYTTDVKDIIYIDSMKYWYRNMLVRNISVCSDKRQNIYIYPDIGHDSPSNILKEVLIEYGYNITDAPDEKCIIINITNDGLDASLEQGYGTNKVYCDGFHIRSALIIYGNILKNQAESNPNIYNSKYDFFNKTDMVKSIVDLLYILQRENMTLSELMCSLPPFEIYIKDLRPDELDREKRAFVMKKLYENHRHNTNMSNSEGINLIFDNGNVTVVPRRSGGFKIISEALSMEAAQEISSAIQQEIINY